MATAVARDPLRVRRRPPDGELPVKLRVSHLVESADFEPDELSPAAILIVRRLRDPKPHSLSIGDSAPTASQAWQRALRSALADLARGAARPAREAVPSNANAIYFADQAELLACFSRDYLRGEAAYLWWWRAMLRSLPGTGSRGLLHVWLRDICYVPAVIAQLTLLGEVKWVVGSFTPEQARAVLQEVARAFDLPYVLAVAENPSEPRSRMAVARGDLTDESLSREQPLPASHKLHAAISPPWQRLRKLDALPTELSRAHTALLGVSLALCESPGVVRSPAFAIALQRWWQTASGGSTIEAEPDLTQQPFSKPVEEPCAYSRTSAPDQGGGVPIVASDEIRSYERQPQQTPSRGVRLTVDGHPDPHAEVAWSEDKNIANSFGTVPGGTTHGEEAEAGVSSSGESETTVQEPIPGHVPGPISTELSPSPSFTALPGMPAQHYQTEVTQLLSEVVNAPQSLPEVEPAIQTGECVATELCGVFFLVNLIKALNIPQAIEQQCNCEFELGSWEWLELIARCLLGGSRADLAGDPIWSLLSILDGRPAEQAAGSNFRPASSYRLPESWIPEEISYATTAGVSVRRNQFELWTSLGFPLTSSHFDGPPSAHPIVHSTGARSLSSIRRMPCPWSGAHALGLRLGRPLQRLLAFLMPYLRWRLAASLGIASRSRPDFAKLLVLRTGKVWMTRTHVDVVMPLKQATSAVRLSGLDNNAGWVADFGRVINFYFQ